MHGDQHVRAEGNFDGLREGLHYVNLNADFDAAADALAQTASRLHRWYGTHSLALQARELLHAATASQPSGESLIAAT